MSQPTPSDSGTPAAGAWKINSICLGLLALLLLLVFWPGLNSLRTSSLPANVRRKVTHISSRLRSMPEIRM